MTKGVYENDTRIIEIFRLSPFVESHYECASREESHGMAARIRHRLNKTPSYRGISVHMSGKFVKFVKVADDEG